MPIAMLSTALRVKGTSRSMMMMGASASDDTLSHVNSVSV
jgi:hypothetical protein